MAKKLGTLLLLLVALTAVPQAAEAREFLCTGTATGHFSGYDGFYYSDFDEYSAWGTCQNAVNNWAIGLCAGQGTTPPFSIEYEVTEIWMGNWYFVGNDSVAWRCDNGWPVYA